MKSAYGSTILIGIAATFLAVFVLSLSPMVSAKNTDAEKITAPVLPDDGVHKVSVVLSPPGDGNEDGEEEHSIEEEEKSTSEEYSHPETGEGISRKELIAYLQEKIADVRDRIEDHIAAKRDVDSDDRVSHDSRSPAESDDSELTRKRQVSFAPTIPSFDDGGFDPVEEDDLVLDVEYIHPETGKRVSRAEMVVYVRGKIAEVESRINALIKAKEISTKTADKEREDKSAVIGAENIDESEEEGVGVDKAVEVDEIVELDETSSSVVNEDEILLAEDEERDVVSDIADTDEEDDLTEAEEDAVSATTDEKKDEEQDNFSSSLMMLFLLIAFLVLIAFAPIAVQYLKKWKERNRGY